MKTLIFSFCCMCWCLVIVAQQVPTLYQDSLSCPAGWSYLGGDRCYKVFQGQDERTWHRARSICERYGSHLAFFKDQEESNKLGELVNPDPSANTLQSFWIGVYCPEEFCTSGAFNTHGDQVTTNQAAAWADGQPNFSMGQCVYSKKNQEHYVYDKVYAQSMDHCSKKRSFVCERMAAPPDSFHCFSGGYVDNMNACNGRRDCHDGSDEMDCPNLCQYYYNMPSGQISLPLDRQSNYDNSQTCTWAIHTPLGSNVYLNFTSFNTEQEEDIVQVYVGSLVEVNAMAAATLSGQLFTDKAIRSPNNMMFIKFSSDGSITASGFTATFGSVSTSMAYDVTKIEADFTPRTYSTPVHEVGGVRAFVGMADYFYVISAQDPYQIVTVEILNLMFGDNDKIVFYDGEGPQSMKLLTVCNSCDDYTVISSTGKYLSIHLMTDEPVESAFTFRYIQGCDVTMTSPYGRLFTPGYMGNINYPNNIVCTWTIDVAEPISIYFDTDLELKDDFTCIETSNDYLQMFEGLNENGVALHMLNGFTATALRGRTFQSSSGRLFLSFRSSSTMNARGFMAKWSKDCVNPMYDGNTIINSGALLTAPFHYTSTMTLTCALGYGFHQQQIPSGQSSVTLTCSYKGEWNWRQIPACTPNYCGGAPDIPSGYIDYATGAVYSNMVSYQCYPGSALQSRVGPAGNNNISCLSNGVWQNPPICQTASCNLGFINRNPTNGDGSIRAGTGDGTTIGSIVDYSCDEGFEIDGDPILICGDNGQWSNNNPTCRRKTCLLPSIPNGVVSPNTNFIEFNQVASVSCQTGYIYESPAVTSMRCLADRTLDQLPVCVDENECNRITPVCQSYCTNTVGAYTCYCDPGYDLQPDGRSCFDRNECNTGEHACDQRCFNTQGGYTCSCSLPYVLFSTDGLSGYFIPPSENGLLPTDTFRFNQSCVLKGCPPPPTVSNGILLPNRDYHRYGDFIEYRCNLGYNPRSTTLECSQNGQWIGTTPTCLPALCPNDISTTLLNGAAFKIGPYNYLEDVDLNCTVATRFFQKGRKCVYNRELDIYQLQGSPYECGVVDCGTPNQVPGAGFNVFDTKYPTSFEFSCSSGNQVSGSSSDTTTDYTVMCGDDGYWNFGNLQCFGQSCDDPGYPGGGYMDATSFADRSVVTFGCTKAGYSLTNTNSLICLGTNFNGSVPSCVDTQPPSIALANGQPCDGTYTIVVKKYESVTLPQVIYSDNDGIASFTVDPTNANSTLKVENDMTVTYRATDYSGYQSVCVISIRVEDETPPTITCPSQNSLTVYIDDENAVDTLAVTNNMFSVNDNNFGSLQPIQIFSRPPTSYSFADLYQTFLFRASVADQNGNVASCQGQVFVTSHSCTPNSFLTPLYASKECVARTFPQQGYSCDITCDAGYTFQDDGGNGKKRTVSCLTGTNGGAWDTAFIPACVRDVTYPRLSCPQSRIIDFANENELPNVDFTSLGYSVTDLNTIDYVVFSPQSYNFTTSDVNRAVEVVLTVTDGANLQSTCRFQYLVLPRICSPLSYPDPLFGTKSCFRNSQNTGYRCTITADDGYVLRDHGVSTTVDCIDGNSWDEVIPAAVADTIRPTVSCPSSRTLYLDHEDDFIDVQFGINNFNDFQRSDDGGIASSTFQPATYNFTRNFLDQTLSVTFTVRDKNNNAASCQFSVHLLAAVCSPLSLPEIVNGQKSCTQSVNGWQCDLTCDSGYGFAHTSSSSDSVSCTQNVGWTGQIPGCSPLSVIAQTVYFGQYDYRYQPATNVNNISQSCGDYYLTQQSRSKTIDLRNGTTVTVPLHVAMAEKMKDGCYTFANVPLSAEIVITFIPQLFEFYLTNIGTVNFPQFRRLNIVYTFTITSLDADYLNICKDWLEVTLNRVPNGYEFAADGVPGNGLSCPVLEWDNLMTLTSEGYRCLNNYFISPLDSNQCRPCPRGFISDSVSCESCPKGTYHASPSSMECTSCGFGRTTRTSGATRPSQCFSACVTGQFSDDGYEPCSSCPVGTYSTDSMTCTECPSGQTTTTVGSSSVNSCISIVTQTEPCGAGTESSGNTCILCSEGWYRTLLDSRCRSCQAGAATFIKGATSINSCYGMCGGGSTSSDGRPPCSNCPFGTYYRNSTYCESCPAGQTTRFVGSTGIQDCFPESNLRVNCPPGTFRDGSLCTKCPRGSYSSSEEANSCFNCPIGSGTFEEGAISQSMCFSYCSAGTRSNSGLSPCFPCGVGYYSESQTTCQQCPSGTTTKTNTAALVSECISECSMGTFSVSGYNHDNTCKPCPANFYQDQTRQTSCKQCLGSQYTAGAIGQTSSSDCLNTAVQDLCFSGRCSNRGNCVIRNHDFYCECDQGYYGRTCGSQVNYCENNPCFNGGNCQNSQTGTGFTCDCGSFATGDRCETVVKTCTSDYCENGGHCRNLPGRRECLCADGFSGGTFDRCAGQNQICSPDPCQNGGQCFDTSFGQNLRRKCNCREGYDGINCENRIDFCESTPCLYGGTCVPLLNDYQCNCPSQYAGKNCQIRQDRCASFNCAGSGTCLDDHTLDEPRCICAPGFHYGSISQYSIRLDKSFDPLPNSVLTGTLDDCRQRCNNDADCVSFTYNSNTGSCYVQSQFDTVTITGVSGWNHYVKETITQASDNYWTSWFDVQTPMNSNGNDDFELRSDLNNNFGLNVCEGSVPISVECRNIITLTSATGVPGVTCTTDGLSCQGFNDCSDYEVRYMCAIHRVFKNNVCTLRDYCSPNPCPSGYSCSRESGTYRCNCPSGLTGQNCQTDIDNCGSSPCKNGGICQDRLNGYYCDCATATGYTGITCELPINYCDGVNCNRGQCENMLTGYRCRCQPGYEGSNCEIETDFCTSQPCLHGGACQSSFNNYFCDCPDGWTGTNCDQIIDSCATGGSFSCRAQCYRTFKDYYCKCNVANTYGRNCEYTPNPCQNYNKCQNGAQCNYDAVSGNMTCACDTRYTGDGCEILVDHCSATTNNCQNGATCYTTPSGYGCVCLPGYTGSNCEQEINRCNVPGVRCPLGMTGVNCQREKETNYDIYFSHPEGLNYAYVPFPNLANNTDSMSVTLWVRYAQAGTEGVYFTMFIGDCLDGQSVKFMDFRHDGVRVYISTDNGFTPYTTIPFTYDFILNNGNWHSIVLNYDLANGEMTLVADSIKQKVIDNSALIIADRTFRFWVVIGCEFDQFTERCITGNRFHGFVSQVNFYKRELHFTQEIPRIIDDYRIVFSPRFDILLVWNEYVLRGGSDRVIPSEAETTPCPGRCRTYSVLSRPTLTASKPCPSDHIVYSSERLTTVSWEEPVFEGAASIIRPEFQSGASYHWGTYQITYVAVGASGEKTICSFKLYVRSSECENPPNPLGGGQTCEVDPFGYKGCELSCSTSNLNYVTDRIAPTRFTCGPTGNWNVMKRFNKFFYPPCGEVYSLPPRVQLYMKVEYRIGTRACESAGINFNGRVLEEFQFLNDAMNGNLCSDATCSDLVINIDCGAANNGTLSILDVTVPDCVQRTNIGGEDMLTQDFITCSVLGAADILNFEDTIPYGSILRYSYLITPTQICPSGRVLINNQCVQCGAGTYYRRLALSDEPICEDCPIGKYQSNNGEMSCMNCSSGYTTEMTGSYDFTQCRKICAIGFYFSYNMNDCMPCPVGYFQDEAGQFFCKFCERGQTTSDPGATSRSACQETCPSGQQLVDNGCVRCEVGFYRNETESRLCLNCPSGKITQSDGSISIRDCFVEACEAGSRLDIGTNTCELCLRGSYQDTKWQSVCISCGDPDYWTTDREGSADPTDCKFYCPSGQEARDLGSLNPYCQMCLIGFYKNNNFGIYDQCSECTGNRRTEYEGSISELNCTIYKCPAGQKPNSGNTACVECPLGTYQPTMNSKDCIDCVMGTSTRTVGAIQPSDCETYCPSGQEKDASGRCVTCPQGRYKNNDLGLFSMCTACPADYTTTGSGAEEVGDCTVRACLAGTYRNNDETACIDCELGKYQQDPYQDNCTPCSPGTSTRNTASTSPNQCESYCPSGTEKNPTLGSCDTCPRGYVKDNTIDRFSVCTLCPIDKITPSTGATSFGDCTIGNCTEGYRLDSNNDCEICPKGSYQDQWWQGSCIPCGTDKTTEQPGADRPELCILECPPGKQDDGGICEACPRGYFKTQYLAAACTICPTGTTTEGTGADDPALCSLPACDVGYYLDRGGNVFDCKKCDYDTYQDEVWEESCKPCPTGLVTLMMGAQTSSYCVLNCTSGSEYNGVLKTCDECDRGYYRNQFDRQQDLCRLCDVNFITASTGATSVSACNIRNCTQPGEYRNVNNNQCAPCPLGTYLNEKWLTECIDCQDSYSTLTTGSTSIADCRPTCPAGEFVGLFNQCQKCPIATYRTGLSGESCTQCPDRLLTPREGAVDDSECTVSPCPKGQYYIRNQLKCEYCERGTYQEVAGKFQCTDCPYTIKYTPAIGADSLSDCNSPCLRGQQYDKNNDGCVACPAGYYQAVDFRFTCEQCPLEKAFTSNTGSTSFTDCKNRCDAGNDCPSDALCISSATGFTCECFTNHRDVLGNGRDCRACEAGTYYLQNNCRDCPAGQYQPNEAQSSCLLCPDGTEPNQDSTACTHLCERGYCQNGATCNVGPPISCTCTEWYRGNTCDVRYNAEDLSDRPLDIAIPVSIAVAALLLILIIIAVACFVCFRRGAKPKGQYTEFAGDRTDKVSVHSYGQSPYNFTSANTVMLAPAPEMVFENQAYAGSAATGDPAVFVA